MRLDLSATTVVEAIDVRMFRSIAIQCRLGSGATTGVVEVKRAFSAFLNTPSSSFAVAVTLDLDGSAIVKIDVTDIAFLHLDVTTADAGAFVDMAHERSDPMVGYVFQQSINAKDAIVQTPIGVKESYRAFAMAAPAGAVSSAVFSVQQSIGDGYPLIAMDTPVALTLDGSTITEIETDKAGFIAPVCTTVQSELTADLYIYARHRVEG